MEYWHEFYNLIILHSNYSDLQLNRSAFVYIVQCELSSNTPSRYSGVIIIVIFFCFVVHITLIVIDIEQFVLFMFMTELCARNADLMLLITSENKTLQTNFPTLNWKLS